MKMKVQIIFEENGNEFKLENVVAIERGDIAPSNIGLSLAESKEIATNIQQAFVEQQLEYAMITLRKCPCCLKDRSIKGYHNIIYRTLFGKLSLRSPRLNHCKCDTSTKSNFSPLASILPERTSPELLCEESRLASETSYGMSTKLLARYFPIKTNKASVYINTHKISTKIEANVKDEQFSFLHDVKSTKEKIPKPCLPLAVGIDGGFVHAREGGNRKAGWFEVIVGKSIKKDTDSKRFGYVTTYDTKPKRRLFEMLENQGLDTDQRITFLSDGGDNVRDLQLYLSPNAEHVLDWFHVTMRITVINQTLKGLTYDDVAKFEKDVESIKWHLWHGHVPEALDNLEYLVDDFYELIPNFNDKDSREYKLWNHANDLHNYIRNNQNYIINYSDRYLHGEIISSAFVESTVNELISKRMVKKQQMRWTKQGAHLLLQVRIKMLNDELDGCFSNWYPGFKEVNVESMAKAA